MERKHIHKHTKKNNRNLKAGLQRFFSTRFFIVLGAIFLLTGVYFSITSSEGSNSLYEMILKLFMPSETKVEDVEGSGFVTLLFYFVPAAITLILSSAFARKFRSISYSVSVIIALYLIGIQIYLYINSFKGGCYYQNTFMASVFLFLPALLLLMSAFLHRKSALLILSCFYFYITIVLFAGWYSVRYLDYLFIFVLFFSGMIAWVGQKMERPFINLINFVLAIGFFGFVLLRKFIVNSKPEFLVEYFTFGMLFYLLFYAIELFSANTKEQPLRKWMQLVMSWTNMLFFLGSMLYLLLKYYSYTHLCVFVPALLLFNGLALLLVRKYVPAVWLLPQYYVVVFLAALLLPLWVQQSQVFLFTAGFSVFMLLYANNFKDRVVLGISRTAMTVTIGFYLFSWITGYLPAIVIERVLPEVALLWNGVLQGVVMLVILSVTRWSLNEVMLTKSKKWFSVTNYNRLITIFLLISLFLTLGWIVFALVCQLTGTVLYTSIGWFISGSLFFITLIHYFAGKQSEFKKPLLYLGFLVALCYPLLLGWNVPKENLIQLGNLNETAVLLHYFAIILWIILGAMTVRRIYERNTKFVFLKQGVQIVSVVYLAFFLCTEYDNLTVLLAWFENSSNSAYLPGVKLLVFNQYIPYSILLGVLSVVVFVYAFFSHKPFLRGCALVLLIGTLVKVFVYDFPQLAPEEKSVVFIVLGILFIVFALLYPLMVKIKNRPPSPLPINRDKLRGSKREEP